MEKMGHSKIFEHKKVGHFEKKKHVIDFKIGKESKMARFDSGAFQKQMHMPSRAKYFLHILFGAFQVTYRT